ncbi:MAG: FtsW/RodA/SpoVE family cell cycle protein [Phycisphaerales bacterium]|nr:FtsW/RodA/SpoVE family cell cycle protein [Phycisphaerales bacterium]
MSAYGRDPIWVRAIRGGGWGDHSIFDAVKVMNAAWLTLIASLALTLIGIYSIDVAEGSVRESGTNPMAAEALKQLVFLIVGLMACVVIALPHYKIIGMFSVLMYAVGLGLLVFLMLPGVPSWLVTPRNGAKAWINLGVADFQPSEVMKIAFVLLVARYMRYRSAHRKIRGLVVPGIIAAVPVALITLQPDLGTASLFVPALFAMLIAAGARLRHLTLIVLCAAMAAPAAYPLLRPHQKSRIVGIVKQFRGDDSDSHGINYQSTRAQTLIGAGQVTGISDPQARALVRYNSLPEDHNDMVFAVVVDRFGLIGGIFVLGLYVMWIGGALLVAGSCRDPLGRMIAVGIPAFIAAQVIINVGMNLGMLPIIGITLPFVSYGGSSLLTCWVMTGLIVNVALHRPRPPYRASFEYADDDGPPDNYQQPTRPYGRSAGFSGRAVTR